MSRPGTSRKYPYNPFGGNFPGDQNRYPDNDWYSAGGGPKIVGPGDETNDWFSLGGDPADTVFPVDPNSANLPYSPAIDDNGNPILIDQNTQQTVQTTLPDGRTVNDSVTYAGSNPDGTDIFKSDTTGAILFDGKKTIVANAPAGNTATGIFSSLKNMLGLGGPSPTQISDAQKAAAAKQQQKTMLVISLVLVGVVMLFAVMGANKPIKRGR